MDSPEVLLPQQTIRDYLAILNRRKWAVLLAFGLTVAAAAAYTRFTTPAYRARAMILVETARIAPTARTGNPLSDLQTLAQPQSLALHLIEIRGGPFLSRVLAKLPIPAGAQVQRIGAESSDDYPGLITVTVESTDPKLAARIADRMVVEYVGYTRETSLKEVQEATRFVEAERMRAGKALGLAEARLVAFRRTLGVPQLAAEQETRTRQVLDLERRVADNANALARVGAQVAQLQAELAREPEFHRVAVERENPRRDVLEGKLAELETQRAALLAEYREGSPMLVSVDAQIKRVRQRLATEPAQLVLRQKERNPVYDELRTDLYGLRREARSLAVERRQLLAQVTTERQKADRLLPREVQLTTLTATRDSARKLLVTMEEKLQDLALREKQWRPAARVFEHARVPRGPFKPRRLATALMAGMLGIILGVAAAFLLEALDDRITTPDQVERELGLPVMGYLPLMPSRQSQLMTALPARSPIAEGYRALRSSISYAAVDSPLRTIAVSSSNASEGKSLTAMNLAIAMALEGRNVILVDADLRRPSLHRLLDWQVSPGLTDVLLGQCELREALRPFPEVPTLQVITCGERPPNPAEMLNSKQMAELIKLLAEAADVVLFDCPPVLPVTDAPLLSTKLDGVLLVAAAGRARRPGLKYTKEQFVRARARLLGLVFNKVSGNRGAGYGYYDRGYHEEDRRRPGIASFGPLARFRARGEKRHTNGREEEDPPLVGRKNGFQ